MSAEKLTTEERISLGKAARDYGNPIIRAFAAERIGESYPLSEQQTRIVLHNMTDEDVGLKFAQWIDKKESEHDDR